MTDAFLETGEHRFLITGVDIDDAVGGETDLGQRRREQVLPGDAPKDLALGPSRDAGGEQGGRCAVDGGVAAAGDFVQRPERQPAARQSAIDGRNAERKNRAGAQRRTLKALNLLAESSDGRWLDGDTHVLLNALAESLFLLCPPKSR